MALDDKKDKEEAKQEILKQFRSYSPDGVHAPRIVDVPKGFYLRTRSYFKGWNELADLCGLEPNYQREEKETLSGPKIQERQILDLGKAGHQHRDSLCFDCQRATNKSGFECSWARDLTLPEGAYVFKVGDKFRVCQCADFIQDEERKVIE